MTKKNAWIDSIIRISPYYKVTEREDGQRDPNLDTFQMLRYILIHRDGRDGFMYTYYRDHLNSMETDVLFVELGGPTTIYKSVVNEEIKAQIRQRFNIPAIRPYEELNTKKILNIPDPTLINHSKNYSDGNDKNGNKNGDKKTPDPKNETLESFLKRTKKITRYCQEVSCNNEIKVYRSKLPHGKGFYCCKEHSNMNKTRSRELNTCLNCEVKYESILPEEFCSIECEEFYNLHREKNQN